MALFPPHLLVVNENLVDDGFYRADPRLIAQRSAPLRRHGVVQRLAHHPPVHAVLFRQLANGLPGLVVAPDLFELFHFLPPVHLASVTEY